MIDISTKAFLDTAKILGRMRKAMPKTLQHVGAIIRRDMRDSLNVDGGQKHKPSAPGSAPHRQTGRLRNSVLFVMNGDNEVVIGSMPRSWGWYARIHEHGARYQSVNKFVPHKYRIGEEGPVRMAAGAKRKGGGRESSSVVKVALQSSEQVTLANIINAQLSKSRKKHLSAEAQHDHIKEFVNFPARPFARPALNRNLDKIPPAFKGIF